MTQAANQSLKNYFFKTYLQPRARFRLSLRHVRQGLTALNATHRERALLTRFYHGRDLSRQQLSTAIELIRKIEAEQGREYFKLGLGGENRKLSPKHLARHILYEMNELATPQEDPKAASKRAHEEALLRIKERAKEEEQTHPQSGAKVSLAETKSISGGMRTLLARPPQIPKYPPQSNSLSIGSLKNGPWLSSRASSISTAPPSPVRSLSNLRLPPTPL